MRSGSCLAAEQRFGRNEVERPIYLDNLATTRLAPEARDAMLPWLDGWYGNASSTTHGFGWRAAAAVEEARDAVADLLGLDGSTEITFTSGATESNNTVIRGVHALSSGVPVHIVATAIEHASVLAPCGEVARRGASITLVRPGPDGIVDPGDIERALRPDTRLVAVMAANNEIGTLQPLDAIGAIVKRHGALFHVDAAQAAGKIDLDLERYGVDFLSVSAHKLHGPQGVGALYSRASAQRETLPPLLAGGGQELGQRSGTLPVAQIAGFGGAARLATTARIDDARRARRLSARVWDALCSGVEGVTLNGSSEHRLPGCLNFSVAGVPAEALIAALPDLALATGAACSSHHGGGSHVLRALGLSRERQHTAVRMGIGRYTTGGDAMLAAELITEAVERVRARRRSHA